MIDLFNFINLTIKSFWNLCVQNWILSSFIILSIISLIANLVKNVVSKE